MGINPSMLWTSPEGENYRIENQLIPIFIKIFFNMNKKYKWGILAPGKMSAKFTAGLKLLENVELYAVGSRDLERSKQFAKRFGFKKYYGSYEELASDPDVDIIYIASPHSHHYEHTMLCLKNKKAVICEKAFALNSREVEEMISEAAKAKSISDGSSLATFPANL